METQDTERPVWKFGSRWSYTGTRESSIKDIFDKYNVAFANTNSVLDADIGDFIALADGWTIIAIGKILSKPDKIKNLPIYQYLKDYEGENVCGCIVRYYWLDCKDQFQYCQTGKFCQAIAIEEQVKKLYAKYATY